MISVTSVCMTKKGRVTVKPITTKASQLRKANSKALLAALFAMKKFFSPRLLESNAFTPTPVPIPTEIIRFWIGKASETAVRAFSLICATNTLSTMLYSACTIIEIIMGMDMVTTSLPIGMVPILFSRGTGEGPDFVFSMFALYSS